MTSVIAWQNLVSNASISAVSSETAMAASNIQGPQGSSATAWQTKAGVITTAGGAQIDIQASVPAQNWRVIGIFGSNLTTSATVSVSLGTNYASPTWAYTTTLNGPVAGYKQVVLVLASNVVADFLRLSFDDPANPDGHINIPLVFAGPAIVPTRNVSWASTVGHDESTLETVSRGGQEYPVSLWQRRRWSVQFDSLGASEVWTSIDPLIQASRGGTNLFFCPDSTSSYLQQEAIFGRARVYSDVSYPYQAADRRRWEVTITERL